MIEDRVETYKSDLVAIRHDLHMHPELLFEEHRTSAIVAKELARLGYQVTTGIAGTGVVGTMRNGTGRRSLGIRADMDALPIHETTNLPYASRTPGKMHACGHDGHTTMLLGAARYLAETRNFDGTVHLIFQPAEEDVSGAKRMIEEGLFQRFPCDAVFALHNLPGEAAGQVVVRPGAITAAVDIVNVIVRGVGGHGAIPHKAVDPIVAASGIVLALQSIVARNVDPHDPAVITVGAFNAGSMATVIPGEAQLQIGVRSCTAEVRELLRKRIPEVIAGQAKSFGCEAEIAYGHGYSYPPGFNSAAEAALVREVAIDLGQEPARIDMRGPFMFSEDFAYMQEVVPSCYFGLGNGASRMLHDAGYDFNDELLVHGPSFWASLVEKFLRAG
ncbi:MAG: amidohydrolase [Rhizobiales bacterium]|nr:amidohydrolase [Hyphomicrobiales bacterium]MBI3674124.1 amidohydrolase [Hyphomicrobiales bacterium]